MGADLAARRRAGRPGQHPTPGARLLAGDNRRRRATPTRPAGPSRCYSTSFPTRAHVTRGVVVSMKQLHDQYRDQVTFVDIVVRQAHPAGQRVPGSDLGDDRRRVLLAGVPHHGMGHRSGRESPGTPTERLRPGRPDRDRSPARWTACGLAPDPDARLFNVGSSAAGDRRLSPSGPHSGSAAMMACAHCGIYRAGVLGEMHPPPVGLDHPLRPFGAQPAEVAGPGRDHVAAADVGGGPRPVAVDLHRGRVRFGRINPATPPPKPGCAASTPGCTPAPTTTPATSSERCPRPSTRNTSDTCETACGAKNPCNSSPRC